LIKYSNIKLIVYVWENSPFLRARAQETVMRTIRPARGVVRRIRRQGSQGAPQKGSPTFMTGQK
jgi:hypothetical protein